MRAFDDAPDEPAASEPGVAAALLAIDAALAGESVEPGLTELAELALILRDERPGPEPEPARALDERLAARFARPPRAPRRARGRRPGRWTYGSGAALAAAAVAVVVVLSGGGPRQRQIATDLAVSSSQSTASAASSAGAATGSATTASPSSSPPAAPLRSANSSAGASGVPGLTPPSPGDRQVVQTTQLSLSTRPDRIDDVAQQVFDVVGAEKGIVESSNVTATGTAAGYAGFALSIPSANLPQTLAALSRLRGAHVASRTDATSDITGLIGGTGRQLAEARALRRSLLRQLAAATTTGQLDSLKAQLRDADAAITRTLAALGGLHTQVAYSKVTLTIQASSVAPPAPATGSSFTLGRAAHDAGRVLVVVAGVALIALAGLIPVGLVAALAVWIGVAVRRRRREQMLDLV